MIPVPGLCECILHESTAKIREQLARVDALIDGFGGPAAKRSALTETQKELKKTLAAIEQNIKVHIIEYRAKYDRNMVEYAKVRAINLGEPVQTNGNTLGVLKKIREPPKKKSKKDKKPVLDGAVVAQASNVTVIE